MALEAETFRKELNKLDAKQNELQNCEKQLEEIILSPDFQQQRNRFQLALGNFLRLVITVVDMAQVPLPWAPPPSPETEKPQEEEVEEEKAGGFSLSKALVVSVAIIASAIVVHQNLISPLFLVGVTAGSITLMFLPQVRSIIAGLSREEEAEKEPLQKVAKQVSDEIEEMTKKYTSARFLTKVQNQSKEDLPLYLSLGIDEALFDRTKYFDETLPDEFLARIRKIMVQCNEAIWLRKSLIISAMATMSQTLRRE